MSSIFGNFNGRGRNASKSRVKLARTVHVESLEDRTLLSGIAQKHVLPAAHSSAIVHHLAKPKAKKPKVPNIPLSLASGPDANGVVTVKGKTYAKAKVLVDFNADGSIDTRIKADKKGNFTVQLQVGYGASQLQVTGKSAGKKAAVGKVTINRADNVAPIVRLGAVSPTSPSRSQVTIAGNVSDVGMGINDLVASIDGGAAQGVGVDAAGNFSFVSAFPSDGLHTIQFIAHDRAGNASTPVSTSYVLDTTAPVLEINSPASGASSSQNPTIQGIAADATTGLSSLRWQVDNGAFATVSANGAGQYSFTTNLPTDNTQNGPHTVTVEATDLAGNVTTRSINFTLLANVTAPVFTSPAQGAEVSQNVIVAGKVSTLMTGPEISFNGVDFTPLTVDAAGNFSVPTNYNADGLHTITVRGINPFTQQYVSNSVSFTLDTAKPTVSITSSATETLSEQNITVTGVAADATTKIASVKWSVDDGTATTILPDANGNFSFTTNATTDGAHTVKVVVTDAAGNSQEASISFTLDSTAPTLLITSPATTDVASKQNITVTGNVADPGSGISSLKWTLNHGADNILTPDGSGNFSFPTNVSTDGVYVIDIYATDVAGNTTQRTINYTRDTVAPTLSIPNTTTSQNVMVAGKVSGTGSNVTVTYQVDGTGPVGTATIDASGNYNFTTNLPLGGGAEGPHTITVTATDAAGNATTSTLDFTLDSVGPAISLGSPVVTPGATTTTISIVGQASDSPSGLANVQVKINNFDYSPVLYDNTGAFIWSLSVASSTTGTYTVTFLATDFLGNQSTKQATFTL